MMAEREFCRIASSIPTPCGAGTLPEAARGSKLTAFGAKIARHCSTSGEGLRVWAPVLRQNPSARRVLAPSGLRSSRCGDLAPPRGYDRCDDLDGTPPLHYQVVIEPDGRRHAPAAILREEER